MLALVVFAVSDELFPVPPTLSMTFNLFLFVDNDCNNLYFAYRLLSFIYLLAEIVLPTVPSGLEIIAIEIIYDK